MRACVRACVRALCTPVEGERQGEKMREYGKLEEVGRLDTVERKESDTQTYDRGRGTKFRPTR